MTDLQAKIKMAEKLAETGVHINEFYKRFTSNGQCSLQTVNPAQLSALNKSNQGSSWSGSRASPYYLLELPVPEFLFSQNLCD